MIFKFDCVHCMKENEIRIQSTIFKNCSSENKKLFQIQYFYNGHWHMTAKIYESVDHFKRSIDTLNNFKHVKMMTDLNET